MSFGDATDAVVVSPYTAQLFVRNPDGTQGPEITANSQVAPGTLYYLRISVSTGCATFRITSGDGFDTGLISNGGFVPYSWSPNAQQDGSSGRFLIRTFSGGDFVTPLFMRVSKCDSGCANPGGTGWNTTKAILFPAAS